MNDFSAAPFIAAEKRQARTVGVPGTLLIGGTRYAARIYSESGPRYQLNGGSIQALTLNAVIPCDMIQSSVLQDAAGATRQQIITHLESGTRYRIDTGGVNRSPYLVYWHIDASQDVAVPGS